MIRDSFSEKTTVPPEAECGSGGARQCGCLPFLIRRDGTWLWKGSVIQRKAMVCLFASALRRDREGGFWLRTPAEEGRIEVEDAPFVATQLEWRGQGRSQTLAFRTNVDAVVVAGAEHPLLAHWNVPMEACDSAEPPRLTVRAGDGAFPVEARISRPVWYELAALAEPGCYEGKACLGVWSDGVFFPLALSPRGCCGDAECE